MHSSEPKVCMIATLVSILGISKTYTSEKQKSLLCPSIMSTTYYTKTCKKQITVKKDVFSNIINLNESEILKCSQ